MNIKEICTYLEKSAKADQYLSPAQQLGLLGELDQIIARLIAAEIKWEE